MRIHTTSLRNALALGLTGAMLVCGATGCKAADEAQTPVSAGGPGWIDRPNAVYDDAEGRAIQAVGIANYNPNVALRRQQAAGRARDELAKSLKIHVQGLVQDYMNSNLDFYDLERASSVEYYESISNRVTDQTLSGSMQMDAWRDEATGAEYVLYRLDFDNVLAAYEQEMQRSFEREAQRERIKARKDEFDAKLQDQLQRMREAKLEEIRALSS